MNNTEHPVVVVDAFFVLRKNVKGRDIHGTRLDDDDCDSCYPRRIDDNPDKTVAAARSSRGDDHLLHDHDGDDKRRFLVGVWRPFRNLEVDKVGFLSHLFLLFYCVPPLPLYLRMLLLLLLLLRICHSDDDLRKGERVDSSFCHSYNSSAEEPDHRKIV